jgi:hypothetical protein
MGRGKGTRQRRLEEVSGHMDRARGEMEFEGRDMVYDVIWSVCRDGTLDVVVYAGKHNVTTLLYTETLDRIFDLVWDEYYSEVNA